METLFKYRVEWHDANGAGESEEGIVWEGFNRTVALEKKRECDELYRTITVLTPGPCGWRSAIQERWNKQEEEAYLEAQAEYYDRVCLEHKREEFEKRAARANTAEVTVHINNIQKDVYYVVTITFYDEDGYADYGFSSYLEPTIRDGAAYIIRSVREDEREKAKEAMRKLGICWE